MNSVVVPQQRWPNWILIVIGLALLGNLIALFAIDLLPDEAYYWVWSQRLALSYFDHPPLIAWLMAPFSWVLGDAAWVIRLQAVASWLVGVIVAFHMAQRLYGGQAGGLAVLVWTTLPIVQVGFHVATPDSPFIIFTWLTYWAVLRGVEERSPHHWLWAGAFLGLALLAKYPAIVVMGAIFFALLAHPDGRKTLVTPWPWLATLIALLLFLPVVIWNGDNDWISFAFQLGHGVKQSIAADPWQMFLLFLGGQLVVAMPWTFLLMAWQATGIRQAGETTGRGFYQSLLGFGFWTPMLVFGIAGLTSPSGPNWPESAYVPGTILLAGALNRFLCRSSNGRIALIVTLAILPVALINLVRFPALLQPFLEEGEVVQRTQLSQSYGWDALAPALNQQIKLLDDGEACGILADNHARAGMIAWLLDAPERVAATMNTRVNQYHLWRRGERNMKYCLYVEMLDSTKSSQRRLPKQVQLPEGQFRQVERVEVENPDHSTRRFGIYLRGGS